MTGNLRYVENLDELATGFNYDLWANLRWLECLKSKNDNALDISILGHILSAQQVWLSRCQGTSVNKMPDVEPDEDSMRALNKGWLEVVEQIKDNPVIHYRRTTGEPLSSTFQDIALHTLNHGTYHRGELRGLCRSREDNDFPETDRMVFILKL